MKGRRRKGKGEIPFLPFFPPPSTTTSCISFPFTGCTPVIPFTDPLCSSFSSRNIGFIFPIKIHRNTRRVHFSLFSPSTVVQLARRFVSRVGIGVEKNTNSTANLESRWSRHVGPCIPLITRVKSFFFSKFKHTSNCEVIPKVFLNLGWTKNWKEEGKSASIRARRNSLKNGSLMTGDAWLVIKIPISFCIFFFWARIKLYTIGWDKS